MGLTSSLVEGQPPEHKNMPRSWLGYCRTQSIQLGAPSHLLMEPGWDALQPGGGLECCAWGKGPGESDPHRTAAEAELTAESVWNQTGELRKWSLATICPHTGSPTRAEDTSLQYKRPVDPGWLFLCPFGGPGNHTSHHTWGTDSCLPEPAGRGTQGRVRGRLSWGHSGSSTAGRQAGRWGRSLWSLANAGAYCRGFSRLTLAPALELQVGMLTGLAPPLQFSLGHSLLPPPVSRAWAGFSWVAVEPHSASLGTSEASARQMGQVRLAWENTHTSDPILV